MYGSLPPETTAVAEPLQKSGQVAFTVVIATASGCGGSMVKDWITSHKALSKTCTEYVPAQSPETVGVPSPTGEPDQSYV